MNPHPWPRLRIQRTGCPRRALVLTDTPRPDCPACEGIGGIEHPYGDERGEYAGSNWELCDCWSDFRWTLLPLPRLPLALRLRRRSAVDPWGRDDPPF